MTISGRLKKLALSTMMAAGLIAAAGTADAAEKHKIFLSMSYIGNDWQAEAANMVKAMAAHKTHGRQGRPAGPGRRPQRAAADPADQRHGAAGAEAIVVFPISPTALNQVVKNACDKGVHGLRLRRRDHRALRLQHLDRPGRGRPRHRRMAGREAGRQGQHRAITGVPGTSVDTLRTKAAKEVFAKHPDIKIVAEAVGMWSQAVARTELSKILATQ